MGAPSGVAVVRGDVVMAEGDNVQSHLVFVLAEGRELVATD